MSVLHLLCCNIFGFKDSCRNSRNQKLAAINGKYIYFVYIYIYIHVSVGNAFPISVKNFTEGLAREIIIEGCPTRDTTYTAISVEGCYLETVTRYWNPFQFFAFNFHRTFHYSSLLHVDNYLS
jgi:hypothetical protein